MPPETPSQRAWEAARQWWDAARGADENGQSQNGLLAAPPDLVAKDLARALTAFAEAVAAAERERIRAVVMALKANGGWGEALAADTILEALRAPADEGGKA